MIAPTCDCGGLLELYSSTVIRTTPLLQINSPRAGHRCHKLVYNHKRHKRQHAMASYSAYHVAIITISVIGITENAIVILILTISMIKEFKKASTRWYILQLAIADTLFLITTAIEVDFSANERAWSEHVCRAKNTIFYINYHSSVLFITVMAIDRYCTICHGFSVLAQQLKRCRSIIIITVAVWNISFLSSLPALLYSDTAYDSCRISFPKTADSDTDSSLWYISLPTQCKIAHDSVAEFAYYVFEFVVMFLVPMITAAMCYALIIKYALLSRYRATGRYLDPKRKRAMITCVVLVVIFLVCWTPHHAKTLALMGGIDATPVYCATLSLVTTILVYVNSVVNPFVYFIMIELRHYCSSLKAFKRICCFQNDNGHTSRSSIDLSRLPSNKQGNQGLDQRISSSSASDRQSESSPHRVSNSKTSEMVVKTSQT